MSRQPRGRRNKLSELRRLLSEPAPAIACESQLAGRPLNAAVHIAHYEMPKRIMPESPLMRKRLGIWQNNERNRAITEIAAAFVNRDIGTLWRNGLLLNVKQWGVDMELAWEPTVTIIVESVEHAEELHQRLPNFGTVTALPMMVDSPVTGIPSHFIFTLLAAHQSSNRWAGVIIHCLGGPHAFDLLDRTMDASGGVVLIDFADSWDEQANRDTLARLTTYSRGFKQLVGAEEILGRDPAMPMCYTRKSPDDRLYERLVAENHVRERDRRARFRAWRGI